MGNGISVTTARRAQIFHRSRGRRHVWRPAAGHNADQLGRHGMGLDAVCKAGFRSLGDAWADTTTSHGRLMLTVLGGLAELERDLIRSRTGEGRERARLWTQSAHQIMTAAKATEDAKLRDNLS
jgi:hypothetical protein